MIINVLCVLEWVKLNFFTNSENGNDDFFSIIDYLFDYVWTLLWLGVSWMIENYSNFLLINKFSGHRRTARDKLLALALCFVFRVPYPNIWEFYNPGRIIRNIAPIYSPLPLRGPQTAWSSVDPGIEGFNHRYIYTKSFRLSLTLWWSVVGK